MDQNIMEEKLTTMCFSNESSKELFKNCFAEITPCF